MRPMYTMRKLTSDAPQAAHFGRPAQAYSQESLAWLKKTLEGKIVHCQIARRDQYGRIVALPHLPPRILPSSLFTGRCISLEMLRAGWVETYEQAGAEYGKWGKDEFLRIQAEAQYVELSLPHHSELPMSFTLLILLTLPVRRLAKRGIWAHGLTRESPAEYKRRFARGSAEPAHAGTKEPVTFPLRGDHWRGGWFRRLFVRHRS